MVFGFEYDVLFKRFRILRFPGAAQAMFFDLVLSLQNPFHRTDTEQRRQILTKENKDAVALRNSSASFTPTHPARNKRSNTLQTMKTEKAVRRWRLDAEKLSRGIENIKFIYYLNKIKIYFHKQ
ncbi:hypothetical protein HRG84_15765 [Flavisolibacter sp. BT320]|nr:hypothetical protein [Flavisolibacter longurius]